LVNLECHPLPFRQIVKPLSGDAGVVKKNIRTVGAFDETEPFIRNDFFNFALGHDLLLETLETTKKPTWTIAPKGNQPRRLTRKQELAAGAFP
jgi:hypothetical protein